MPIEDYSASNLKLVPDYVDIQTPNMIMTEIKIDNTNELFLHSYEISYTPLEKFLIEENEEPLFSILKTQIAIPDGDTKSQFSVIEKFDITKRSEILNIDENFRSYTIKYDLEEKEQVSYGREPVFQMLPNFDEQAERGNYVNFIQKEQLRLKTDSTLGSVTQEQSVVQEVTTGNTVDLIDRRPGNQVDIGGGY